MVDIHLKQVPLNPAQWQQAASDRPLPLQQHPVYGLALESLGYDCSQVDIYDAGALIGYAILAKQRFYGIIGWTKLFRGPVWTAPDISNVQKSHALRALAARHSKWRWNFLTVMPELPEGEEARTLMKTAGLRQVMTGFSTIWLDLRKSEETLRAQLHGKWRNQLAKAEKAGLTISFGGRKPHQYSWLLEKEAAQKSQKNYAALPAGFIPDYIRCSTPKSATDILSITAIAGREKVAGGLFLRHGNSATYHIGWAGDGGRAANAQNLILWQAILRLKEQGVHFLDLGGLNTAELAGIARFKLGLGAEPVTLAGGFS